MPLHVVCIFDNTVASTGGPTIPVTCKKTNATPLKLLLATRQSTRLSLSISAYLIYEKALQ